MILSHDTGEAHERRDKSGKSKGLKRAFSAQKGGSMHQRLISETAFNMTRVLLGMIAHEADDEEYRRQFEQVFQACRASLESYSRQVQRMQQKLHPMGGNHVPATATE